MDIDLNEECYLFRRTKNPDEPPVFHNNFYLNYKSLKNSKEDKTIPKNEMIHQSKFNS